MEILPASAADEPAVRQLLACAGLPTRDLTAASLARFLVLRDGDALVGTVGLDLAGDVALLRSLVVGPQARGRGLGGDLLRAAEARAAGSGVRALYLLTTTADAFFAARGYAVTARERAPPAIQAMPQFRELCPASSILMARAL